MGLSHSPKVVTDGLVFYMDQGNTDKSWKGAPTTNLITNPLPNGTTAGFAALGGVGTLTYDTQTEAIKWVRTSYETWGAYHTITPIFNGTLSTSVQYSISFEWKVEGNAFSNNVYVYELVQGNAVSPAGTANLVANSTLQPNGWFLFKYTFTPANAGVGDAYNRIYFPSQSTNTSTFYWRKIQFEQNAFATPFVAGTRSTTQAVLDMTKQNTIIANNVTYASNGSFSFNGSANPIKTSSNYAYPNNMTWGAWVKRSSSLNTYNMFMGAYLPYFSFRSGNFVTFSNNTGGLQRTINSAGVTLADNTWYHFMFTSEYDGTTDTTMKIYINGVLNNTGVFAGSQINGGYPITIGSWYPEATDYPFSGIVDSVNVYNRALTAAEIQQNFNAHRGRYGI